MADMRKYFARPQAVRKKCLDCSCGSQKEVALCTVLDCPIYLYRFGRKPSRADVKQWRQDKPQTIWKGKDYSNAIQ